MQISSMTVVVRAIFHENNKYYPQVFIHKLKDADIKNCVIVLMI